MNHVERAVDVEEGRVLSFPSPLAFYIYVFHKREVSRRAGCPHKARDFTGLRDLF